MGPIFESELEPEAQIDPKLSSESELGLNLEPEQELNSKPWLRAPTRAQLRAQAQLEEAPELIIELERTRLEAGPGSELGAHLVKRPKRKRARADTVDNTI